jgi:hypothetical protein
VPARPGKPKDKAKVEVAVQVAQRWVLARLRNETFFSLAALNERIRELTGELNARPMRAYGGESRRVLFERLDKPALRPLCDIRFEVAEWGEAKVNRDYHPLCQEELSLESGAAKPGVTQLVGRRATTTCAQDLLCSLPQRNDPKADITASPGRARARGQDRRPSDDPLALGSREYYGTRCDESG